MVHLPGASVVLTHKQESHEIVRAQAATIHMALGRGGLSMFVPCETVHPLEA